MNFPNKIIGIDYIMNDLSLDIVDYEGDLFDSITSILTECEWLFVDKDNALLDKESVIFDFSNNHNPAKDKLIIFEYIEEDISYWIGLLESDFKSLNNLIKKTEEK